MRNPMIFILGLLSFLVAAAAPAVNGQAGTARTVLTSSDFIKGRTVDGNEFGEDSFWLQVSPRLPPVYVRLLPDAQVKDNAGSNNPLHHIGRIEVSNEARRQTIDVRTRAGFVNFTRLFTVMDVNFDGYLDIAVVNEFGAKWGRLNFWLFDPRTGRYVTNALTRELAQLAHNGIKPDPVAQELAVMQFPQPAPRPGTLSETYKIADGHLILIKREILRETGQGLKVVSMEWVNGKWRAVLNAR